METMGLSLDVSSRLLFIFFEPVQNTGMNSEIHRLQGQLSRAESRIDAFHRELDSVTSKLRGMTDEQIFVPSGVPGFSNSYRVLGNLLGAIPAADDALNYQWKISPSVLTNTEPLVDIDGGTIATQGAFGAEFVTVPAVAGLAVADEYYVYISFTRNTATREIINEPVIAAGLVVPNSSEITQYIKLGKIFLDEGSITKIIQLRFEEINVWEDLAVANGEFKLVSLEMSGKNPYALPSPPSP